MIINNNNTVGPFSVGSVKIRSTTYKAFCLNGLRVDERDKEITKFRVSGTSVTAYTEATAHHRFVTEYTFH
jgi:hypothetical protein